MEFYFLKVNYSFSGDRFVKMKMFHVFCSLLGCFKEMLEEKLLQFVILLNFSAEKKTYRPIIHSICIISLFHMWDCELIQYQTIETVNCLSKNYI